MTSKDGTTEWVLARHATEFKEKGADFIKTTYGVKEDDLVRTTAKKDAVENAERELKAIQADVKKRNSALEIDTKNFELPTDPSPKDETRLTRPSGAALMACCNNSTCYCAIA